MSEEKEVTQLQEAADAIAAEIEGLKEEAAAAAAEVKAEEPKAEEAPVAEEAKAEEPKTEETKQEAPAVEEAKAEEPKQETPAVVEAKAEESKTEEAQDPEDILAQQQKKVAKDREWKLFGISLAVLVAAIVCTFLFIFGVKIQHSDRMAPAVADGEFFIFYRLDKRFCSDDIVLLNSACRTRTGLPECVRIVEAKDGVLRVACDAAPEEGAEITADDIYGRLVLGF